MVTTVVAAMGRHVVAVDPMKEHLSYLHRALELLGNEGNVRLLNNAVRYLTLFLMGGRSIPVETSTTRSHLSACARTFLLCMAKIMQII